MGQEGDGRRFRDAFILLTMLGAFLTVRGYRSLDGDQAYRFPLLVSAGDPTLYPVDPFVDSFHEFNPHRGAIAVIGGLADVVGLGPALFALFVATFCLAVGGIRRLAQSAWPDAGDGVGHVAAFLFLAALAGNVGTNHLFEPLVLDRQMALALIWYGLAGLLSDPVRGLGPFALLMAIAAVVHPTFSFQASALVAASIVGWRLTGLSGATWPRTLATAAVPVLAVLPGLDWNLMGSGTLLDGLPLETFRRLSLELQGPQHMLPHLWRLPQWLAWGCFPALAALSVATARAAEPAGGSPPSVARSRLLVLLGVTLLWLGASWVGVVVVGHLRFTLFQPFRMATVARGLCLVLASGHVQRLWNQGGTFGRTRAALVVTGLTGDWSLVAVTAAEAAWTLGELVGARRRWPWVAAGSLVLAMGLVYLSRHDTESGHVPLLAVAVLAPVVHRLLLVRLPAWTPGRRLRVAGFCWVVPLAAFLAGVTADPAAGGRDGGVRDWLVKRCRFAEVPIDDIERLALWCRSNTPKDALFVGPPGPKTFRLWSQRSLAFNRAGSPYNARGLGDWADRFADHIGFSGDTAELVRAYQADRHGLERGYDRLDGGRLASLAARQGADYLVVRKREWKGGESPESAGLVPVREEGRYVLYRAPGTAGLAQGRRSGRLLK